MKKIIKNYQELLSIDPKSRRHYYLDRNFIALISKFSHSDEKMVNRNEIEKEGILVKPFWEDGGEIDDEGLAFLNYLKTNPEFDMMIRAEVLNKLVLAQSTMPKDWRIVLKAGLRPVSVQRELFQTVFAQLKAEHPDLTSKEIDKECLEYVTDPDRFIPPHSTGGAVDILVINHKLGVTIDMGSPINAVNDASWCDFHEGFTQKQIQNRETLITTMIKAGFANLASEWWHYSYGDPRWAIFYDKKTARYPVFQV